MSFSINTNTSSQFAGINANKQNNALDKSLNALSSGDKIIKAALDAAGLSIADKLSAQVSGLGQAMMNSNDSIGMMQVAEGGLQGINDNFDRIRVLTLQASNDTLNAGDRANIQKEIDGLLGSSNDIANQTSFNGKKLLDGSLGAFTTQAGANSGETQTATISSATVGALIGSVDVTTADGRNSALDNIDNALKSIGENRSNIGAAQNQLMSNIRNLSVTQVNSASAASQIQDVDFAKESANFSQANVMSQIGSFAQAQSNAVAGNVTRLFQ